MLMLMALLAAATPAHAGTITVTEVDVLIDSIDTSESYWGIPVAVHVESTTPVKRLALVASPPAPFDPMQRRFAGSSSIVEEFSRVMQPADTPLHPDSGTQTDGTWLIYVYLPRFAAPGTWNISRVYADNEGGDVLDLQGDALIMQGLTDSFEQVGEGDIAPPELTDLTVSSHVVDVSDGPAEVTVTATMDDPYFESPGAFVGMLDLSMMKLWHDNVVDLDPQINGGSEWYHQISDSSRAYFETYKVPAHTRCGELRIDVQPMDSFGNRARLDSETLASAGFPTVITVKNPTNCGSTGGPGDDEFNGSDDRENFSGGAGEDNITGGGGRDELNGGSDDDLVVGAGGPDVLAGGAGNDTIRGGGGNDTIRAVDRAADRVTCGAGRDVVYANASDKVARDCERVIRTR
jgi:hypothetical protein